jgi:hypothetical protein
MNAILKTEKIDFANLLMNVLFFMEWSRSFLMNFQKIPENAESPHRACNTGVFINTPRFIEAKIIPFHNLLIYLYFLFSKTCYIVKISDEGRWYFP